MEGHTILDARGFQVTGELWKKTKVAGYEDSHKHVNKHINNHVNNPVS